MKTTSHIISRTVKHGKVVAAQVVFKGKHGSVTRHMQVQGNLFVAKDGTILEKS